MNPYNYCGFLLLTVFSLICFTVAIPDYAISLTDATFEHQTQASTGQTTGNWLVLFYDSSTMNTPPSPPGEPKTEEEWLEHHVVLATVDTANNPAVTERFGYANMWVYLHKAGVSVRPTSTAWEELYDFTANPGNALKIPPPKSTAAVFDLFEMVHQNAATLGLAFGVLGVRLLVWLVRTYAGDNAHRQIRHANKKNQ